MPTRSDVSPAWPSAGLIRPRRPRYRTSLSTSATNVTTSYREMRESSSSAASMPCVRTSIVSRHASLISASNAAAHCEAGGSYVKLRVLARLLQIQRVLLKHGLDDFVRATH